MEKNYYDEGFESFLREKTDEYKLYPSDKVWGQIHRRLHPRSKWPFLAAALLLLGIGMGTRYVLEDLNQVPANGQGQTEKGLSNGTSATELAPASETQSSSGTTTRNIGSRSNPRGASPLAVASLNPSARITRETEASFLKVVPAASPIELEQVQAGTQGSAMSQPVIAQHEALSAPETGTVLRNFSMATVENRQPVASAKMGNLNPPSKLDEIIATVSKVSRKTRWQLYFTPSVSYRKLDGKASKYVFPYNSFAYSTSYGFAQDVNDAVRHRPAIGMEFGTALLYPLNRNLRVKAGLQLNYNSYQVEAYSYVPEIAPFGSNGPGSFANSVNTMSYYRNFNGFDKTMLKNAHMMIALPLGVELTVVGNNRVKFNVASTIQPTYVINNEAYLISTNLKNYAQEPSLYRKWNVNAGAEAFLSINTGTYSWVVGPQFRYQILSSYKNKYPIQEHLMDFGFKIGVNKTIR